MALSKHHLYGSFIFLALSVAIHTEGWSQDEVIDPHRDRLWFNVGLGLGRAAPRTPEFSWGLTGGIGMTYQPGLILLGLHTDALWNPFHGDILGEAAVLVGLGTRGTSGHASIAMGPALVSGDLNLFERDSKHFSSALGFATQVQFLGIPLSGLGGGMTAFLNLNAHQSFGGVRFNLAFGQLR